MISVYRADQLKRFAPFSYLNHSFILSLNVKVCIRFIVFLQISLCFFICQELCWMRGLCISFTSLCFLLTVGGGLKCLRTGGEPVKKFQDYGVFLRSINVLMCCSKMKSRRVRQFLTIPHSLPPTHLPTSTFFLSHG